MERIEDFVEMTETDSGESVVVRRGRKRIKFVVDEFGDEFPVEEEIVSMEEQEILSESLEDRLATLEEAVGELTKLVKRLWVRR